MPKLLDGAVSRSNVVDHGVVPLKRGDVVIGAVSGSTLRSQCERHTGRGSGRYWRVLPIATAIFAVACAAFPASAEPRKIVPIWSVVGFRFETKDGDTLSRRNGSGVYVEPGVILTAAHVIEPLIDPNTKRQLMPGFAAGDVVEFVMHYSVMKAKVLFVDHQSDRAALEVLDEPDDPPLPLCRTRPEAGQNVGILFDITGRGAPAFGDTDMIKIENHVVQGRLPLDVPEDQRHDEDMFAVTTMLQPGASGGGIIDLQTLCVHGIISYDDGTRGSHTFAIPVDRFFEAKTVQPEK